MRSLRLTPTELAAPHSPLGLSESALAPLLPPIPVLSPPQILPHPATAHRLSSPRVWAPVLPLNRAALTNYRSICPTFHLKILTYRNCERIINCTTFHLDSAIVNILPCLSVCVLSPHWSSVHLAPIWGPNSPQGHAAQAPKSQFPSRTNCMVRGTNSLPRAPQSPRPSVPHPTSFLTMTSQAWYVASLANGPLWRSSSADLTFHG